MRITLARRRLRSHVPRTGGISPPPPADDVYKIPAARAGPLARARIHIYRSCT